MNVDQLSKEEVMAMLAMPEDNLQKQRARASRPTNPADQLSKEEVMARLGGATAAPAPRKPAKPATPEFHLTEFGGAENKAGPLSQATQDQDERERAEANGILMSGGGVGDVMDGASENQRRYMRQYLDAKAGEDAARGFAGVAAGNLAGPLLSRLPGVSSALARGGGAGVAARLAVGAGEGAAGSLPQAGSVQDIATGALVGSGLRAGGAVAGAIRNPLRATGRTIRNLEAAGMDPSALPGRVVKGTHNPDGRTGPWRNPLPPEQTGRPHGEAGTEQMAGEAEAAVKENMGLRGALNSDSLGEAKNDLAARLGGWDAPVDTSRAMSDLGTFVNGTRGSSGDPMIDMADVRLAARNLVSRAPGLTSQRPGSAQTRLIPKVQLRELNELQKGLNAKVGNPPPGYDTTGAKQAQGLVSRTMREADPLHGPDPDTIGGALDRYGAEKDQLKRMNDIIERMPNDASPADNVGKESQARRFFEQAGQETRAGRAPEYDELAALDPVADVHVRRMRGRNAAESLRLKPPKWLGPRPDVNILRTVTPSQNVEALAIRYGIPLSVAAEVLAPFSGSAQAGRNQRRGAHLEIFGE